MLYSEKVNLVGAFGRSTFKITSSFQKCPEIHKKVEEKLGVGTSKKNYRCRYVYAIFTEFLY